MSRVNLPWTEDLEAAIRRLEIFAELNDQDLQLLKQSTAFDGEAGEEVINPEQAPGGFTFLIGGRWTMKRKPTGAKEPVIWKDERPGSWHGGVRVIDVFAPALVTLDIPSRLLFVPEPTMFALVAQNATIGATLLRGIEGGAALIRNELIAKDQ